MGWADEKVQARIKSLPAGIRYLGYVPEADLPALTKGASLLAYPSLYEGFGLPVAQAMAAGVAVLTSNTSSMPEVAGPGARFADPQSPAEIASALAALLESKDERTRLGLAGRQLAEQRYRWPIVARKSLAFLRSRM
jgi:alpha-1,3-rhamnosyl/mannosyltransferase